MTRTSPQSPTNLFLQLRSLVADEGWAWQCHIILECWGFPPGSVGKESACKAGDLGLIPGLGRSLEKGMATHFSTPAWRIPRTEEPGGLQSMGSQRVRHDRGTNTFTLFHFSGITVLHNGKWCWICQIKPTVQNNFMLIVGYSLKSLSLLLGKFLLLSGALWWKILVHWPGSVRLMFLQIKIRNQRKKDWRRIKEKKSNMNLNHMVVSYFLDSNVLEQVTWLFSPSFITS